MFLLFLLLTKLFYVFLIIGHNVFPFRSRTQPSSLCWPESLEKIVFLLSWRSSKWSFHVSRITINMCTGSLAVCDSCFVSNPVQLLLSILCNHNLHSAPELACLGNDISKSFSVVPFGLCIMPQAKQGY